MKYLILILELIFLSYTSNAQSQDNQLLSIGEIRYIDSKILDEKRTLNVYLPPNYTKEKEYPVIYVLDGSINEDFIHIVGLVQFFQLQLQMPEFIVVGIANVDRKRDFTFHTDLAELKKDIPTAGHSKSFIAFIEKELQPYINANYKTKDTKYLIGQSLGGLLASEILLTKSHLFTHYLIVSPSLWWDNESLLKKTPHLALQQLQKEIYAYISVGKKEHIIMRKTAKKLLNLLKKSKIKNLKIDYQLMKKENHATILHNSIYQAFIKLFPYKK